jgi:hypothetical protein
MSRHLRQVELLQEQLSQIRKVLPLKRSEVSQEREELLQRHRLDRQMHWTSRPSARSSKWIRRSERVRPSANADNQVSINLQPRHLPARVPAKREAEKSKAKRGSINLQPHRLAARGPVRCKAEERERKVPMVNLPVSQQAQRQLRLSRGKGNPQRKRERGLHRQDHNNFVCNCGTPRNENLVFCPG